MDEPNDFPADHEDHTAAPVPGAHPELDLDAVEHDLAGVERALARLEDGTYWQCEDTGATLPDELLAADPLATRLPAHGTT